MHPYFDEDDNRINDPNHPLNERMPWELPGCDRPMTAEEMALFVPDQLEPDAATA